MEHTSLRLSSGRDKRKTEFLRPISGQETERNWLRNRFATPNAPGNFRTLERAVNERRVIRFSQIDAVFNKL